MIPDYVPLSLAPGVICITENTSRGGSPCVLVTQVFGSLDELRKPDGQPWLIQRPRKHMQRTPVGKARAFSEGCVLFRVGTTKFLIPGGKHLWSKSPLLFSLSCLGKWPLGSGHLAKGSHSTLSPPWKLYIPRTCMHNLIYIVRFHMKIRL